MEQEDIMCEFVEGSRGRLGGGRETSLNRDYNIVHGRKT